jgi:hypothetical protein
LTVVPSVWVSPKFDSSVSVARSLVNSTPAKEVDRSPEATFAVRPRFALRVFVSSSNTKGNASPGSAGSFSFENSL